MGPDKTFEVTEPTTLLPFLLEQFPSKGRNKVKGFLTHHQVTLGGSVITRHDHPLLPGNRVTVHASTGTKEDALHGVKIMFEDRDLLVVDKPAGLLSIATDDIKDRTAYRALMEYVSRRDPKQRVFIVHRLDRDTSGVMMFARSEAIQQALQENWKETVKERTYLTVVEGKVQPAEGTITAWLKETNTQTMYVSSRPGDGIKTVTHYRMLRETEDYSLLEVRLETGKKNQIRVHMQSIGHSVVGDKRYGSKKDPLGRLGLHAGVLAFKHPISGEVMRFEATMPPSFRKLFPGK